MALTLRQSRAPVKAVPPPPRRTPAAPRGRKPFRDNTRLLVAGVVVLIGLLAVLLTLAGESATHKVLVSVGGTTPKPEAPDCEIECSLADLWAIQSGSANPFQLMLDGKIRIQGNAGLALAVGAALG